MKSNSHRTLGLYLIEQYLTEYPERYRTAFSFGCIQPDKNPVTYLKGSFRSQWLRGHNWENAKQYIQKVGDRLQACKRLRLLDFYRLGKLIHYTADAFTYAHNMHYTETLSAHRCYEKDLHEKLKNHLSLLKSDLGIFFDPTGSVSGFISKNHSRYMCHQPCMEIDTEYCVRICAQVLQLLLQSKCPIAL